MLQTLNHSGRFCGARETRDVECIPQTRSTHIQSISRWKFFSWSELHTDMKVFRCDPWIRSVGIEEVSPIL